MHLPKVAERVRPPRMLHMIAPLGKTFGNAYDYSRQKDVLRELLEFSLDGGDEELRKSKFKYIRQSKNAG